jgi:hypothetical protein
MHTDARHYFNGLIFFHCLSRPEVFIDVHPVRSVKLFMMRLGFDGW